MDIEEKKAAYHEALETGDLETAWRIQRTLPFYVVDDLDFRQSAWEVGFFPDPRDPELAKWKAVMDQDLLSDFDINQKQVPPQ